VYSFISLIADPVRLLISNLFLRDHHLENEHLLKA